MRHMPERLPAIARGEALAALARNIAASGWRIYYDVSPLFEEHWTGIPVVAAGLAQVLLRMLPETTHFFYEHHLVTRAAVEDALGRGSGLFLHRDFFKGPAQNGVVPLFDWGAHALGIYPSVKRVRQLFPLECSIVHDLSTLVTPQFHEIANIRYHAESMMSDLRSNAVTFGVSRATVEDIAAYLGIDERRLAVAYNGVSWPWWFPIQVENEREPADADPYFLVLGTREPRKNIVRIFEVLALFPELLDSVRIVIAGRMGWLREQQMIPPELEKAIATGRLVLPGFVSEFEKYCLLSAAAATIYPSFFEGFGLPVLESLSVGTPCIASFSSAIPEVGGPLCTYFDPFSAESLYRAIRAVLADPPKQRVDFREACRATAERFTWEQMLFQILTRMMPEMERHDSIAIGQLKLLEHTPSPSVPERRRRGRPAPV